MCFNCTLLKSVDLSNFDVKKAISCINIFFGCESLKELKISNDGKKSINKNFNRIFSNYSKK